MIFEFGNPASSVNLSHVKIDVRKSPQLDGKVVRPSSSESIEGSAKKERFGSSPKKLFQAVFQGSAKK